MWSHNHQSLWLVSLQFVVTMEMRHYGESHRRTRATARRPNSQSRIARGPKGIVNRLMLKTPNPHAKTTSNVDREPKGKDGLMRVCGLRHLTWYGAVSSYDVAPPDEAFGSLAR